MFTEDSAIADVFAAAQNGDVDDENSQMRADLLKIFGKKRIESILQEAQCEDWKSANSKACPKCSANIEVRS